MIKNLCLVILKKYQQQPGQANLVKNQAEIMLSEILVLCCFFYSGPCYKMFVFFDTWHTGHSVHYVQWEELIRGTNLS